MSYAVPRLTSAQRVSCRIQAIRQALSDSRLHDAEAGQAPGRPRLPPFSLLWLSHTSHARYNRLSPRGKRKELERVTEPCMQR